MYTTAHVRARTYAQCSTYNTYQARPAITPRGIGRPMAGEGVGGAMHWQAAWREYFEAVEALLASWDVLEGARRLDRVAGRIPR